MLLTHPAISPGIVLILALGTTGRLRIQGDIVGVYIRVALYALRVECTVDHASIRSEAGIIHRNADVCISPWETIVPFFRSTVFTRLVVLLTAGAYRQYPAGKGDVKGICDSGRREA